MMTISVTDAKVLRNPDVQPTLDDPDLFLRDRMARCVDEQALLEYSASKSR